MSNFEIVEEFLAEKTLEELTFLPVEPKEEVDISWSKELCDKILKGFQEGKSIYEISVLATNRAGKNPSKAQIIEFKKAVRQYTAFLRAEKALSEPIKPAEDSD